MQTAWPRLEGGAAAEAAGAGAAAGTLEEVAVGSRTVVEEGVAAADHRAEDLAPR